MPARKTSRTASKSRPSDPLALLRTALAKKSKAELTDLVLELAREDGAILRELSTRFHAAKTPADIVAATRMAISEATDFDERLINQNFDYDYEAYATVKENFRRLIEAGQLPVVMDLALELMKDGSYQAECSDECLMSYDLEECFNLVIDALRRCDLPADVVAAWCQWMLKADRLQCIARDELTSLAAQVAPKSKRKVRN